MNKTKIIATIGPASQSKEILKELILKGMDVARINLSHGDYSFCMEIINNIRGLNKELKTNVAIMLDTVGPEIRIGKFVNGCAKLICGQQVKIVKEEVIGDKNAFSLNRPEVLETIKFNSCIKLDDGKIKLKVIDKEEEYIICEVINDGVISDGKSVNIENHTFEIPFICEKDKEDIRFANMMNVDFLALSFVRDSEDILKINDLLIELENDHIGLIAKIETKKAVDGIDEIIKVSDGIMIARGDLGVELPLERVPSIQKMIINKCQLAGKTSILATELLSSMEVTLRPTRAEVSDVANAVLDGVDAVMLSGETTIGNNPVLTLETMEKIIKSAEENIDYVDLLSKAKRTERTDITGLIAYSVADSANRLEAKAIVIPTISGYTARKMSRFRPSCPIIAISPDINTVNSLTLNFGVYSLLNTELNSFDKIIKTSIEKAVNVLGLEKGDKIIVTGGYPLKETKHTNFMKIEEI